MRWLAASLVVLAAWCLLLINTCSCISGDIILAKYTYETSGGWKLHTKEVDIIMPAFKEALGRRLSGIDDCIVALKYPPFDKKKWIFKLKEQECFSDCHPKEEFLCFPGHKPFCREKEKVAGEDWSRCPCRYRTGINYGDKQILIPMRSKDMYTPHGHWVEKTTVEQLNLWDMLRAHVGGNWHKQSIAQCVGGCM